MKTDEFSQYDSDKLERAKRLLMEVLDFNYGAPRMASKVKRLETIIAKLEALQNLK